MSGLIVEDIMTKQVKVVNVSMTLRDVIQFFLDENISGAPVVEVGDFILSMVGEKEILKMIATPSNMDKKFIDLLDELPQASKIVTADKSEPFIELYKKFVKNPVRQVVVIDGTGKVVGIISRSNILRAFMQQMTKKEQASGDQEGAA